MRGGVRAHDGQGDVDFAVVGTLAVIHRGNGADADPAHLHWRAGLEPLNILERGVERHRGVEQVARIPDEENDEARQHQTQQHEHPNF